MGHDEPTARLRPYLLLSVGVARVHLPWCAGDLAEPMLDLLERPDDR